MGMMTSDNIFGPIKVPPVPQPQHPLENIKRVLFRCPDCARALDHPLEKHDCNINASNK